MSELQGYLAFNDIGQMYVGTGFDFSAWSRARKKGKDDPSYYLKATLDLYPNESYRKPSYKNTLWFISMLDDDEIEVELLFGKPVKPLLSLFFCFNVEGDCYVGTERPELVTGYFSGDCDCSSCKEYFKNTPRYMRANGERLPVLCSVYTDENRAGYIYKIKLCEG